MKGFSQGLTLKQRQKATRKLLMDKAGCSTGLYVKLVSFVSTCSTTAWFIHIQNFPTGVNAQLNELFFAFCFNLNLSDNLAVSLHNILSTDIQHHKFYTFQSTSRHKGMLYYVHTSSHFHSVTRHSPNIYIRHSTAFHDTILLH